MTRGPELDKPLVGEAKAAGKPSPRSNARPSFSRRPRRHGLSGGRHARTFGIVQSRSGSGGFRGGLPSPPTLARRGRDVQQFLEAGLDSGRKEPDVRRVLVIARDAEVELTVVGQDCYA